MFRAVRKILLEPVTLGEARKDRSSFKFRVEVFVSALMLEPFANLRVSMGWEGEKSQERL